MPSHMLPYFLNPATMILTLVYRPSTSFFRRACSAASSWIADMVSVDGVKRSPAWIATAKRRNAWAADTYTVISQGERVRAVASQSDPVL